jgi:DNA-directed RNA polymerase specialized sigma24 family protein
LNYQEIADIRQCSLAGIKVKVHRARQKLKKLLLESDHG